MNPSRIAQKLHIFRPAFVCVCDILLSLDITNQDHNLVGTGNAQNIEICWFHICLEVIKLFVVSLPIEMKSTK